MGSSLGLNHKVFMLFEFYQRVPPLNFLKFSVCKKRLISLKGLFLGFSAICDFFYQILFLKKIFLQVLYMMCLLLAFLFTE